MDHVVIPDDVPDVVWVVTADTLTQDADGIVYGKPESKEEAIANIKKFRQKQDRRANGMCVARFQRQADGSFERVAQHDEVVVSRCQIDLPDFWLETFFERQPIALQAAGGIALEGYGMPFLNQLKAR